MANNTGWMDKQSLGRLSSTTDSINRLDHPVNERKNSLSKEKNVLLEDFRSGLLTASELQVELKKLK